VLEEANERVSTKRDVRGKGNEPVKTDVARNLSDNVKDGVAPKIGESSNFRLAKNLSVGENRFEGEKVVVDPADIERVGFGEGNTIVLVGFGEAIPCVLGGNGCSSVGCEITPDRVATGVGRGGKLYPRHAPSSLSI
jgi:hypothetical protein